jgi:sugar phosphate isomerase/epimerase
MAAEPDTAVGRLTVARLARWKRYLDEFYPNDYSGPRALIGEVGCPNTDQRWLDVLAEVYEWATDEWVEVAYWATGSKWGDYQLAPFEVSNGRIQGVTAQGQLFLKHANSGKRGVNVSGLEWGGYPRVPHHDFLGDLSDYGVTFIRLPVSWERINREAQLETVERLLVSAETVGLGVIVDVHNYARYDDVPIETRDQTTMLGLARTWSKIARRLSGYDAVKGYGIMNEPFELQPAYTLQGPLLWEEAARHCLTAIRLADRLTPVYLAPVAWGAVDSFEQYHGGTAILDDPHVIPEGHLYFDADRTGGYTQTFEQAEARARERGY